MNKSNYILKPGIIWKEFRYGGHLLSIGASSIIYLSTIVQNQKVNFLLLLLGYVIIQVIYALDHIQGLKEDIATNPEQVSHLEKNYKLTIGLLVTYIIIFTSTLFFLGSFSITIFSLLYITVGIFLTEPFKKLTKHIIGIKNFYVAIMWALLSFIPSIFYNISLPNNGILSVYIQFFSINLTNLRII